MALGLSGARAEGSMLLRDIPSDCLRPRGLTGCPGSVRITSASSSGSWVAAHSRIGAAAGDASSRLGSRTKTSGAAARRCSSWCLAALIGPSGRSRSSECRSSSPRKAIFGVLRSHEELDRFARMMASAVQPRAVAGVSTLTLPEASDEPLWMLEERMRGMNSSTHFGPISGAL